MVKDDNNWRSRSRIIGSTATISGVALPFIVWFMGQAWMRHLAAQDPTPNQGAMVVAFLLFCASILVAAVLIGWGVLRFIQSLR